MRSLWIRSTVVAATIASLPLSSAQACGFLDGLFGCCKRTTYFAPVAAPAPACCPQTVNYVPQTCFRTVYVNQQVVSFRPTTACDPCTGCPTTVMRPVASCVMRPQLVPYTTFRPVVTNFSPSPCQTGCAPAATTTFAPVMAPAPAAAAPACCSPSLSAAPPTFAPAAGVPGTTIRTLAPQTTYASVPIAAPVYPGSQPALAPAPTPAPTLAPPAQAPSTFAPELPATPQSGMMVPQYDSLRARGPASLDGELIDRTTSLPVRQALVIKAVSTATAAAPRDRVVDNDGWRAAK